ncbi:MAG: hypothetical protein ACTSRQ_09405 [Candidatus Thorarchaeota archaeon]
MKDKKTTLTTLFENLTKEILKHRIQLVDSDWDELKMDIYEPEILSFTSTNMSIRYKPYTGPKDRFVKRTKRKEILSLVRKTEAFDDVLQFLIDHSCQTVKQKDLTVFNLNQFIGQILDQNSRDKRIIQNAVTDALCLPVNWKCKAYLIGLTPEISPLKSSDMLIRIPDVPDFPKKGPVYSHGEVFPPPHTLKVEYHTIIEWIEKGVAKGPDSFHTMKSHILDKIRFLRLVKSGSWILTGWEARSDWVFGFSYHKDELGIKDVLVRRMNEKNVHEIPFNYFSNDDLIRYDKLRRIKNNLRTKSHGFKVLRRAMEFFDEASQRQSIEAVVFNTIGLECLYSGYETEQQFKVATRTSIMLQSEDYPRETIFDDILDAYDIRNKFVHGSETHSEQAVKVVERLTEYLRRSILIWMQSDCLSKKKMEAMQEALLRSTMNEGVLEKVQKKIKCAIF